MARKSWQIKSRNLGSIRTINCDCDGTYHDRTEQKPSDKPKSRNILTSLGKCRCTIYPKGYGTKKRYYYETGDVEFMYMRG